MSAEGGHRVFRLIEAKKLSAANKDLEQRQPPALRAVGPEGTRDQLSVYPEKFYS